MYRSFRSLTMRAVGVLAMASLVGAPALSAQGGTITGIVTDAGTGEPVTSAQVFIVELDLGALSQASGRYLLLNVPPGTQTVTVQRIGFRDATATVQVAAGQTVALDFVVSTAAIQLDQLIVTGTAGGSRRRALGNTVARIDATAIAVRPVVRIEEAVGSGIPGVRNMKPAGSAGTATEIRIRSANSLALALGPLIYVDGIRINTDRAFANRGGATSRLQDIDPNTIESIEIIKGPAAATLYGTEASNGVIQIITKKGIEGETVFDLSLEGGANWQPHPSENFGLHWWKDPDTSEIRSYNLYEYLKRPDMLGTDMFTNGAIKRFSLNARGGGSLVRYFAGVSRDDQQGYSGGLDYTEQWSSQASISVVPSETLSFTVNASNLNGSTRVANNLMLILDLVGRPIRDRELLGDGGAADYYLGARDGQSVIDARARTTWSIQVAHNPVSWFSHRLTGGVDRTGLVRTAFTPLGANSSGLPGTQPQARIDRLGSRAREGRREITDITTATRTIDYSATATYSLTDQIGSSTSVGFQYFEEDRSTFAATGREFAAPSLSTISGANVRSSQESFLENVTVGTYIQNEFNWEDRIFLTGAVRFDDNSAFGTDFEAAIYPKVSGSWVISEEDFWGSPLGSNEFRLRGAWGKSGMQPDAFAASRLYTPITGPGEGAFTPLAIGNPDLGPEVGQEIELGFDASFVDDRVGVEFTWYSRVTKDAIVGAPIRPSIGFPGVKLVNIGQTSSWGTETAINWQALTQDPVRWDMRLAFGTMGNRIDDMGGLESLVVTALIGGMNARGQLHVEGYPIASLMEKEIVSAEFVSGTSGAIKNVMCDDGQGLGGRMMGGPAVPCADADRVFFGPGDPTWSVYFSSVWTLLQDWRFSVTLDALGGNWVNGDYISAQNTRHAEKTQKRNDAIWTGFIENTRDGATMYRADFLKLREVALRYSLPSGLAASFGASSASIVASMYNIATLWARDRVTRFGQYIWDQEMQAPNFEYQGQVPGGTAPPMSRATLRVNLTF